MTTTTPVSHETYTEKVTEIQKRILELGLLVFQAEAVEENHDGPDLLLSDDVTLEEADTVLGELAQAWSAIQTGVTAKSSETDLVDHLTKLASGHTDIDAIVMDD